VFGRARQHTKSTPRLVSLVGVPLTALGSAAEVLVATGHDAFARASLRRPLVRGWVADGVTAWIGTDAEDRTSYLSALGEPTAVAALLGELLPELPPRQRVTLPRGTASLLPAWVGLGPGGADWDFRWLPEPPPPQGGEELVVADLEDGPVAELLSQASPRASALPGDPAVRRWWGVPDGRAGPSGRVLACVADTSAATGVGHLSSITVHPTLRGQGLGKAVTAALARRLFEDGCDVITLGTYADNTRARGLYDALGFRDEHRFTSGPLVQRGRW
jgi:ribosomal protein S18 acetylase RimI-like enzyme